jgi:hypothetical protein
MEFRWIAVIALWTLLIGPIVGVPTRSESKSADHTGKPVKTVQAPRR